MVNESTGYNGISLLALASKDSDEIASEDSREPGIICSGNKTVEDPVWIINGPKSQSAPFVQEQDKLAQFEQSIMPHMDAAYNLARWLGGNDSDAQDIVQEAYLRAFKFFSGFRDGNSRAWLLRIVRNCFYDWLKKNRGEEVKELFDEELHDRADEAGSPDVLLLEKADHEMLHKAIVALPVEFREILVLRELEGLSYREISDVSDIPLGTVMSRLARGREQLRSILLASLKVT